MSTYCTFACCLPRTHSFAQSPSRSLTHSAHAHKDHDQTRTQSIHASFPGSDTGRPSCRPRHRGTQDDVESAQEILRWSDDSVEHALRGRGRLHIGPRRLPSRRQTAMLRHAVLTQTEIR